VNPTTGTSYSVTYTLGQCTPGTATVNVFVNPAPTVTINTTSICVGQSATLTATPTETGGTYLWSPGGQTGQAITVNPTQTTTYSVTYSLGQCTQATASSILTVQPVPTITLSSPTICTGTNANITATVLPTGGSYSWSTGATTNSLSVNPTTNTNYSLTYSVNGCTNSAQTTVTVFETPTVTVNSPTICAGESTTITATANPSGGTYLWSNNATNSTQVLTPTGTISYNILYVIQGCNASATSTITVNPVPTLTLAGSTICAGESTTLTAIPNLQGGTFLWSPNGETTNVISVTPGQTSNYSVVYTLNNCLSPSFSATVTVNPMPIVTVNSGQICSGDSFTLQANGTPLGGTYTWTGHANTTSQLNVSPNSTTSYTVNYTLNGCVSQSATGVVDILPSPVASFTASATQGCSPLTVTFTNTSISSSGNITGCLWGFGNTTSSGCGSMSQTFTQPGCYNISLAVTSNGCTTIQNMPNMICVQADPVASFMANPNSFSQTSQEITFVNTSTGATQFEWDFGNGNTSNDYSPSHFYTNTSGGQTVTLTASSSFGCTAQTSVFIPFTEAELI
jgi:PKD repeat protein